MIVFEFNDHLSTDFGITVERIDKSMLAIRDRDIIIAGKRGRYPIPPDIDQMLIRLQCRYVAKSYSNVHEVARQIAAWLSPESGIHDLEISAIPNVIFKAQVMDTTNLDIALVRGRFVITFKVPDGVGLGDTRTWQTGQSNPWNLSAVKVPLKITAVIGESTPDLELTMGEETFLIDGPFVNTDEIIITENDFVTVNGDGAMDKVDISSDFFEAPIGEFEVTADPASTQLTIEWTERFL